MKDNTCKKLIFVVFVCVFLVMFVFNIMTPMISDDYAHYFCYYGEHPSSLSELIQGLFQIGTNSRYIPHFFVYLFLSMPRFIFCVVNAFVSVAIVYLISRFYSSNNYSINLILLFCSVFMLWYFTPGFGQIYLWLTGACNYSWGLALDILLLYPLFCEFTGKKCILTDRNSAMPKALYIILAFVVGAYSENGGACNVFATAFFVVLIWLKNKKFPIFWGIALVVAFSGFIALMLAPNTSGNSSNVDIFDNAKKCVMALENYELVLICIFAAILAISISKKVDVRIILSAVVFFFAGLVSIAPFVFAKYLPNRSFMIVTTYLVIAILILLSQLPEKGIKNTIFSFASVLFVLFAFSFVFGAGDIMSLYMQSQTRQAIIAEAKESGNLDVELPAFKASGMYPAAFYEEMAESPEFWYNDLVAKYYGLKSVTGTGVEDYSE